jgi:hypothetical protein
MHGWRVVSLVVMSLSLSAGLLLSSGVLCRCPDQVHIRECGEAQLLLLDLHSLTRLTPVECILLTHEEERDQLLHGTRRTGGITIETTTVLQHAHGLRRREMQQRLTTLHIHTDGSLLGGLRESGCVRHRHDGCAM